MRIAIVGGTGRTGRRLVDAALAAGHTVRVLSRAAFDKEGIEEVRGDALDPERLRTLVRGAEAVVSVVGPVPSSPPDVCSRSTQLLIEAMKAEGVRRLVVQTGALIGHPQLGWTYRWLAGRRSRAAQLEERRAQERAVQRSGLDWTLIRPPRLTDGKGTGAVRVGPELPIRSMASVARVDLAQVLLRAATGPEWSGQAVAAVKGFTANRPGRVLGSWVWAMGLAELLGLGAAAAIATGFLMAFGEPQSLPAALAFLACMLAAGAIEGLLLGELAGGVLASSFPHLSRREFRRNTVLVALAGWLIGMLPATLSAGPAPPVPAAEPPAWALLLAASCLAGALAGAGIGAAQWLALRKAVPRAGRWIAASALGWALGLPLALLAGALAIPAQPGTTLFRAAGLGLAAGLVVALPTGVLLLRMLKERRAARAVSPPAAGATRPAPA